MPVTDWKNAKSNKVVSTRSKIALFIGKDVDLDKQKNIISGITYALLSSLTFSVMNVLVKAVSTAIPSNEIVFFRSIIGTVLILFFMKKEQVEFSKSGIPMLLLRGCAGAFYMIAYFYAISNMPLIDAIVLVNMSPVFVIVFAHFFLKEKILPKMYPILPVVFVGAMITINPFSYSTFSMVAVWGILAAMFSGIAAVCIRYLGQRYHAYEIIFYFMITATIVSIPLMWSNFVMPNIIEWCGLIIIGVVSLLAQVFLTRAFTSENAVTVEFVRYIGIVFNAFWGFAFWKEIPSIYTIIGGVMIVFGCIAIGRIKNTPKEESVNKHLMIEKETIK